MRGDDQVGTDHAWNIGVDALKAINKLNYDHILDCIADIRRDQGSDLIFYRTDGASLRDF